MPKTITVKATDPGKEKGQQVREARTAEIEVQTAETAKEAINMFGDEAVLSNANSNWVVTLQAGIRRMLVAGKSLEEIQKEIGDSKMGVSRARTGVSAKNAIKKQWANWSPEERAAFIKEMKESTPPAK